MLSRVLPLGGNTSQRGSNGKLLELADHDVEDALPVGSRSSLDNPPGARERHLPLSSSSPLPPLSPSPPPIANSAVPMGAPSEEAIASVVTQATREASDTGGATATTKSDVTGMDAGGEEGGASWRSRFRSMLCCLAPITGAGGGQGATPHKDIEEGPVVLRPPPLSELPHWPHPVIGPPTAKDVGKKTLVLDLDETLVHSSFRPVHAPDYVIPVEIEGRIVDVYVMKRPYVDHFLRAVGERFEVIVFTASLGKYADPLIDLLDTSKVVRWRLFRESCVPFDGSYVKDLQCLGRDARHVIIVDNSPHSYAFQPENAIAIGTFIDDMEDSELLDCLEILLEVEHEDDVRVGLAKCFAKRNEELSRFLSSGPLGEFAGR